MKKILKLIRNVIYSIALYPIIFLCEIIYGKKAIFCECYMHNTFLPFRKQNWGDDLNKYLFEYGSNIKILNFPFSKMLNLRNKRVYSLIGSIISFYTADSKTIYGTGAMNPNWKIIGKPNKIISVRGPKTRQVLIANGIDCPESYGDPVLLLPVFYKSDVKKIEKGGVIVNMGTDINRLAHIKELFSKYNLEIISMTNYNNWTDVIDEICSCQYIISESLHGLIVAETYGIPNVWVEFVNHPDYWDFKFQDFYESIGKKEEIIKIKSSDDLEKSIKAIDNWQKGNIDYEKLKSFYPFDIKANATID